MFRVVYYWKLAQLFNHALTVAEQCRGVSPFACVKLGSPTVDPFRVDPRERRTAFHSPYPYVHHYTTTGYVGDDRSGGEAVRVHSMTTSL